MYRFVRLQKPVSTRFVQFRLQKQSARNDTFCLVSCARKKEHAFRSLHSHEHEEIPRELLTFPREVSKILLEYLHFRTWGLRVGSGVPRAILSVQERPSERALRGLDPPSGAKGRPNGNAPNLTLSFRGQQGARARTRPEVGSRHANFEVHAAQYVDYIKSTSYGWFYIV